MSITVLTKCRYFVFFFWRLCTLVHSTKRSLMSRSTNFNEIRTLDPLEDHLHVV